MPKFTSLRNLSHFAAGSALALLSAGASAFGGYSLSLRGEVPVICRASVKADGNFKSGLTGELNEFCNSPGGYAVHGRLNSSGSGATLTVDGEVIVPNADGTLILSTSDGPNIAAHKLQIAGAASGTTLSLQIVPL